MDLTEIAYAAAAEIRRKPGQHTREIAAAIDCDETVVYVALYRLGRHLAVGLTALNGWHTAASSSEIADRLLDEQLLPPCPPPGRDERHAAALAVR